MATKKKMLQAAAGQATGGGAGLDITEVFSTYLYEGNGFTQTITNDIDLDGEGGLVWVKWRSGNASPGSNTDHILVDTERGTSVYLESNSTSANKSASALSSFNSDGFTTGGALADVDNSGDKYASWTFRKAPKFFTCVTWSGNGTAGRAISHDLGSVPGMMVVKNLTTSGSGFSDWRVWHRSESSKTATLNTTAAFSTTDAASKFGNGSSVVQPTSTEFTVAADYDVNRSGETYVAYLFAHNDGDGGFGPDGDADIIKCGSVTTVSNLGTVDLGWEPQFVLIKKSSAGGDWLIFDSMRGMVVGSGDNALKPNSSEAEGANNVIDPTANGFKFYGSDGTYIYMAIRRGPLAPPESGTEVFAVDQDAASGSLFQSGFPVDMSIWTRRATAVNNWVNTRLLSPYDLRTDIADSESNFAWLKFDHSNGVESSFGSPNIAWMWKRAPSFFDVVAYTGDGVAGRTVNHNLGVAPEMMVFKARDNSVCNWFVYHKDLGNQTPIKLNSSDASVAASNIYFNSTTPDASEFTLGTYSCMNSSTGLNYIAYLFATLPGVSKVGSYTGNGSSQTIDCGFTSGARFVLIKRTDSTGDWYVWDTARGIVAGNDPHLSLNTTAAEVTSDDSIDPDNSGFIVNQLAATNINVTSASYIYYAVS